MILNHQKISRTTTKPIKSRLHESLDIIDIIQQLGSPINPKMPRKQKKKTLQIKLDQENIHFEVNINFKRKNTDTTQSRTRGGKHKPQSPNNKKKSI